jgi:hypothetical protein
MGFVLNKNTKCLIHTHMKKKLYVLMLKLIMLSI